MTRLTKQLAVVMIGGAALAWIGAAATGGATWNFRGPNRDGISSETGLVKSWSESGPPALWRVPVGEGFSGLALAGGKLYTLAGQGEDENALCFDAATGKELWRAKIDAKYHDGQGNGPRSTPLLDSGRAYVVGAKGKLLALDAATGKTIWRHDLAAEYGARMPDWGIATTPLLEGGLLLVDVGGKPGHSMMAFDPATGKQVWASDTDGPGYSAPVAVTIDGVRQALFFRGTSLASVNPKDGTVYWRLPWRTDWDVNAATPIFVPPNRIFVSSGYNTGSALLQIKNAGGKPAVEKVWESKVMKNQFSSSVVRGGHVYGFDNKVLKCINLNTGEERWKQSGLGHGSLVLADGHLFVLSERGQLVLVEAKPEAYVAKGAAQILNGKCWTAPSLLDGKLYLRNEKEMVCLNVAA